MEIRLSLDHSDDDKNNNNDDDSQQMFNVDKKTSLCLVRLANNVTYQRLQHILRILPSMRDRRVARVAFNTTPPHQTGEQNTPPVALPLNQHLNVSQIEAVRVALTSSDMAVIHGPPGTGKTTTVVELVRQLVARQRRVLVCAPSNTAVDNLVSKLV